MTWSMMAGSGLPLPCSSSSAWASKSAVQPGLLGTQPDCWLLHRPTSAMQLCMQACSRQKQSMFKRTSALAILEALCARLSLHTLAMLQSCRLSASRQQVAALITGAHPGIDADVICLCYAGCVC